MTTIVNEAYRREHIDQDIASKQRCFTRSPLVLPSSTWANDVIPYLTPPNLGVNDEELHLNNELQFQQEANFAMHLSPSSCTVIKLSDQTNPEALGASLKRVLDKHCNFLGSFFIELPMVDYNTFGSAHRKDLDGEDESDQWDKWQKFHAATDYSTKVEVSHRQVTT